MPWPACALRCLAREAGWAASRLVAARVCALVLPASVLPAALAGGFGTPAASARLRPSRLLQAGQGAQPRASRTFSAIAICSALVARSAREAYLPPPLPSHVPELNWTPP